MANRPAKFKVRRGTEEEWAAFDSAGYILEDGQFGYDTTNDQLKIGDGASTFASLLAIGTLLGKRPAATEKGFRVTENTGDADVFYVQGTRTYATSLRVGGLNQEANTQPLARNVIVLPAGSDPATNAAATSAPEGTLIFVKE